MGMVVYQVLTLTGHSIYLLYNKMNVIYIFDVNCVHCVACLRLCVIFSLSHRRNPLSACVFFVRVRLVRWTYERQFVILIKVDEPQNSHHNDSPTTTTTTAVAAKAFRVWIDAIDDQPYRNWPKKGSASLRMPPPGRIAHIRYALNATSNMSCSQSRTAGRIHYKDVRTDVRTRTTGIDGHRNKSNRIIGISLFNRKRIHWKCGCWCGYLHRHTNTRHLHWSDATGTLADSARSDALEHKQCNIFW